MEIIKDYIHMNRCRVREAGHIFVDDDFNVPDTKKDIKKILGEQGKVLLGQVRASKEHIFIEGTITFHILYLSDDGDSTLQSFKGTVPFNETITAKGVTDGDKVCLEYDIEEIEVRMINSRKISLKAIINYEAKINELYDEEVALLVEGENDIECYNKNLNCMGIFSIKNDVCRVKEEVLLPSNKPNVAGVLWSEYSLGEVDIRLIADEILISGNIAIFILYICADEEGSIQWYETAIPFKGNIECKGCSEGMIPDIQVKISQGDIEIKPDYDGEDRNIVLDMVLDLNINIYKEEKVKMLMDAYSLKKSVELIGSESVFNTMLMRSMAKFKVDSEIQIPNGNEKLTKICNVSGEAFVDESTINDNAIDVSGKVKICIFYVMGENGEEFDSFCDIINFNHSVRIENISPDFDIKSRVGITDINFRMKEDNKVDVEVGISIEFISNRQEKIKVIKDIEEGEKIEDRIYDFPGITGYVAKPGETLWEIAKNNYTTVDRIKEVNELIMEKDDVFSGGEKLLLIKVISQ